MSGVFVGHHSKDWIDHSSLAQMLIGSSLDRYLELSLELDLDLNLEFLVKLDSECCEIVAVVSLDSVCLLDLHSQGSGQ